LSTIGRSRVTRLVLLLCGALVVSSVSFRVSVADAGALEGLPGPVREVTESVEEVANGVAPTVQEVTEAAPPPVAEVTETAAPPVVEATVEATQAVVPPVKEVAETATHATQEAIAKVPSPVVTTPKLPSVPAVDPSGETKAVTQTATHDVEGALGAVTGAVHAGRSPASGGSVGTSTAGGEPTREASAPTEADSADSAAKATGESDGLRDEKDGLRNEKFSAPSPDGAIRAPLPKWMAYVWPAIALTWRDLAGLLTRWEHDGARLSFASDGGAGGSHGVAGVHASHTAGAASGSSSSPLGPIPAAIGGFTSHLPDEALAYLAIVGILVVAVFVAVKLELAHGGRGPS
jgi:hypothetical protein